MRGMNVRNGGFVHYCHCVTGCGLDIVVSSELVFAKMCIGSEKNAAAAPKISTISCTYKNFFIHNLLPLLRIP